MHRSYASAATCAADLDAGAGKAADIPTPKVDPAEDAQWVADRAPGTPLICARRMLELADAVGG
jgi:citrate lyase subunit beta / citryl-CoA lyase